MSNETIEIDQLNSKIRRNVAAKEREERTQKEADREEKIDKAFNACRVPVLLAAATMIAAVMGLATATLATIVTAPCLLYVCYQAGTAK